MAVIDDHFVATAVTTAQTYNSSNRENGIDPIVMVAVSPTVVTVNYSFTVAVSFDNSVFRIIYTSATLTSANAWRRIVFSGSGAASDTDTVTIGATINKSPILEPFIQVVVTPSSALTAAIDIIYSDPSRG